MLCPLASAARGTLSVGRRASGRQAGGMEDGFETNNTGGIVCLSAFDVVEYIGCFVALPLWSATFCTYQGRSHLYHSNWELKLATA